MFITLLDVSKISASAYQYKGIWPDFGHGLVLLIENIIENQIKTQFLIHNLIYICKYTLKAQIFRIDESKIKK